MNMRIKYYVIIDPPMMRGPRRSTTPVNNHSFKNSESGQLVQLDAFFANKARKHSDDSAVCRDFIINIG